MVERSLSMREVPGSIPGASKFIFLSFFRVGAGRDGGMFPLFGLDCQETVEPGAKVKDASSGNRTRAARVAGEHSTTEPTMLLYGHGS